MPGILLVKARLQGGGEAYLLAYGSYAAAHVEDEGEREVEGVVSAVGLRAFLAPDGVAHFTVLDSGVEFGGLRLYLIAGIRVWLDGEQYSFYATGS